MANPAVLRAKSPQRPRSRQARSPGRAGSPPSAIAMPSQPSPAHLLANKGVARSISPPSILQQTHLSSPPSPDRNTTEEAGLFERDVEFPLDHMLSVFESLNFDAKSISDEPFFSHTDAQEAVDVAIPPVLQSAASAMVEDELPEEELQSLMRTSSSSALNILSVSPTVSPTAPAFGNDLFSQAGQRSPSSNIGSTPVVAPRPIQYSASHGLGSTHQHRIAPSFSSSIGMGFPSRAQSPPFSSHSSSPPESNGILTPAASPSPKPLPLHLTANGMPLSIRDGIPLENVKSPVSHSRSSSPPHALSLPMQATLSAHSLPPSPRYGQMGDGTSSTLAEDEGYVIDTKRGRRLSFMSYADIISVSFSIVPNRK